MIAVAGSLWVPTRGPLLITNHGRLRAHPSTLAPPDVTRSRQATVTPPAPQRQLRAKQTCGPARLRNRVANTLKLLYPKRIISLHLFSWSSCYARCSCLPPICTIVFLPRLQTVSVSCSDAAENRSGLDIIHKAMLLSHLSLLLLCLLFAGDFLSLFQLLISLYPFFY